MKRNLEVTGKEYSSQPSSRRKALAHLDGDGSLRDDLEGVPFASDRSSPALKLCILLLIHFPKLHLATTRKHGHSIHTILS